jgi:O-antigen/teichoic acid export membrane protein
MQKDVVAETAEALEMQSFKKKSVSGAISYTLRSLVLYGIGLVTSLILSAYLSVVDFAVFGLVTQIIGLLQFFSDVGLGPALIQKKEEPTIAEYRLVFTVQQMLSWFIFLIVFGLALSGVLTPKIGSAGVMVLLSLGLAFPLSSLKVIPAIMLERKLDFSKLVIPNIAEQLVYNVLLVWLVLGGYGIKAYAVAILARSLVGVAAMYWIQRWPAGWHWDRAILRKIIGTGVVFQASDLLARIKDQLFYLVLGFWLPAEHFGYITWSKNWSQVPYMLTVQNVIAITFPAYSRLQHDPRLLAKAINKTMFFISLAIFPLLVGMTVFIWPLTQLVSKYQKWEPAVLTFALFTMSIGWAAISTPLTNTLSAVGRVNTTFKLMVLWTILTWILTPLCIKFFGFNGVAVAAALISVTSVIPVILVQKFAPIRVWDHIWRQLFAAAVMAAAGLIGLSQWQRSFSYLFLGMLIVGSVYFLALLPFHRRIRAEWQSLR